MEKEVGGVTAEAIDNIRKVAELKTALHLRVLGRIDDKKRLRVTVSLSYKNGEKS